MKPASKRFTNLANRAINTQDTKFRISENTVHYPNGKEVKPLMANDETTLLPYADVYLDNAFNVLLVGLHGTGKTQSLLDLAESRGLKMKYFSCSTLDPYTDLVGVPVPMRYCPDHGYFDLETLNCPEMVQPESGKEHVCGNRMRETLRMVRPLELDDAELIFFDEFNRADPKTQNAVFEIIQFRSINGEKLPNLKACWAAMNPPEEQYQVEELDPALLDRFDVYVEIEPHPSVEYMSKFIAEPVARALKMWWEDHGRAVRTRTAKLSTQAKQADTRIDYVSPRRLMKIGLVWEATHNSKSIKASLPMGGTFDTGKLIELLKAADKGGFNKEAPGMGDGANDTFTYTPAWFLMNRKQVTEWLDKNPNALETHRKVLDTLSNGVGGQPLIEKYGEILDSVSPSLLEGFFTGMPDVKKSQMRTGFKSIYRTNRNKAKGMKNLYKVLEKGARPGHLPDITV